jgi:hypothetical protein
VLAALEVKKTGPHAPVLRDLLRDVVVDVDRHLIWRGAAERLGAGLPEESHPGPILVRSDVRQVDIGVGLVQLPGRFGELVPRLGWSDPVLVEDVLPIEHAHRSTVLWNGPDFTVLSRHLAPRPLHELIRQLLGAVWPQIEQGVRHGESGDVLELDLNRVGCPASGLQCSAELGVLRLTLAGIDHGDVDRRIGLFEQRHFLLDVRDPRPECQLRRGLHRLVDLCLAYCVWCLASRFFLRTTVIAATGGEGQGCRGACGEPPSCPKLARQIDHDVSPPGDASRHLVGVHETGWSGVRVF